MAGWFREQWKQVAPNAKWDLAKWAGAAMLGAATYLLHFAHAPDALVALIVFVVALVAFVWLGQRRQAAGARKLTIHSAIYGTGPDTDIDVTDILQRQDRDALAIVVCNELFGKDPHFGALKRLEVEYSYGNQHRFKASRPENARMVLPEDTAVRDEMVRLAQAINVQQNNEPRESSEESLSTRVTALAHDLLVLVRDAGPKHDSAAFVASAKRAGRSDRDILAEAGRISRPRIDAIHYGYQARFVDRVERIVNELAAIGITDGDLHNGRVPINTSLQTEDNVRALAEKLLAMRNRLEISKYDPPLAIDAQIVSQAAPAETPKQDWAWHWRHLAGQFEKLSHHVRADWQCNRKNNQTVHETWNFSGDPAAHSRAKALCLNGGELLAKSPAVTQLLLDSTKAQADPMSRWLFFLKDDRHQLTNFTTGEQDDGTIYLFGSIQDVASASVTACIECNAREI